MKKIIAVFLIVLLCGCTSVTKENIASQLNEVFSSESEIIPLVSNTSSDLYSYYLPSDMQEKDYGDEYIYLGYENSEVLINLNVGGIIGSRYYGVVLTDDGFFDLKNSIYVHSGELKDPRGRDIRFNYKVSEKDGKYYVLLTTGEICMYGCSTPSELKEFTRHLMTLTRSFEVRDDAIVSLYSRKGIIDYQKKQVDLFEKIIPSSGILEELIVEN